MLDEGRYFKRKSQVLKLLDEMARLKMNVFHCHLVDDQGWRIEIKKYPLLTKIGSKRLSTQVDPKKWSSQIQSGVPHEGFYTQEEIKEIVSYAKERHIMVVPEIEMPEHSSAAIVAYPWLGLKDDTKIASSGLVMAIVGGAVLIPLQEFVSDELQSISYSFYSIIFV